MKAYYFLLAIISAGLSALCLWKAHDDTKREAKIKGLEEGFEMGLNLTKLTNDEKK